MIEIYNKTIDAKIRRNELRLYNATMNQILLKKAVIWLFNRNHEVSHCFTARPAVRKS
jgi:hypothetical protein